MPIGGAPEVQDRRACAEVGKEVQQRADGCRAAEQELKDGQDLQEGRRGKRFVGKRHGGPAVREKIICVSEVRAAVDGQRPEAVAILKRARKR